MKMLPIVDKTFSEWLYEEMEAQGLSQAGLARKANLSRTAIHNVLNENRQPGNDLCLAVSAALNLEPVFVFQKAGLLPKPPPETEQQRQLVYLFNQLPEDEQKRLVEYAGFLKAQHDKNS